MTNIQNGTPLPATAEAHNEITFGRMISGRQERDVLLLEARGEKARGHRLGRFGGAVRVRTVDLHQLPEQFTGWRRRHGVVGMRGVGRGQTHKSQQHSRVASMHGPILQRLNTKPSDRSENLTLHQMHDGHLTRDVSLRTAFDGLARGG